MYEKCRKEEKPFNECVFTKLVMEIDIGTQKNHS
jgi:hypothetical protein